MSIVRVPEARAAGRTSGPADRHREAAVVVYAQRQNTLEVCPREPRTNATSRRRRRKWFAPRLAAFKDQTMELPEMIDAGDLVLKRWESAWAEDTTRAVVESLPELQPFMPWAHDAYDVEAARSYIELTRNQWAEGTAFAYAIFNAVGTLVGSCGLMTRMGPGTLEIGYWIRSEYTGRGYASGAVAALTHVALPQPGIERVAIKHDAANPASGAVAAKAGFTEVERFQREPEAPGESGLEVVWERRR